MWSATRARVGHLCRMRSRLASLRPACQPPEAVVVGMSTRRQRARYVVRGSEGHGVRWMVFDKLTLRLTVVSTRQEARLLAKVKNAEDRLKRRLANAVQLELLDD